MKRITCIVDNTVKHSTPLWGEHGLAFWIEIDQACVLFDTGASETVLQHNLTRLGKCPGSLSALALSHAHWDHTGGLQSVLWQQPKVPIYANPDLLRPRFALRDGQYRPIGMSQPTAALTRSADLRLHPTPVEIAPGLWTTGEIHERSEPVGGSRRHVVADGDAWVADPYRDDMALVLEITEGLVLICGCCHAGLLNTLTHVQRVFGRPITTILGGTHLLDAGEAYLHHVVAVLRDAYGAPHLYLNHCTGDRARQVLAGAFRSRVAPCPVGTVLTFNSEPISDNSNSEFSTP